MSLLDPDPGPWLTTAQAAPLLGMPERTVSNMCTAGEIEHRVLRSRTGLRIRYRLSPRQIAKYVARTTVSTR